jgi:hypothetical protein
MGMVVRHVNAVSENASRGQQMDKRERDREITNKREKKEEQ